MIVITGASDGLGLELARLYHAAGKRVVNISRRKCAYANPNVAADLRKHAAIRQAAAAVMAVDEPLEALINCAGVLSVQPLGAITGAEIDRVLATNVKAGVLLVSELAGRIKRDGTDIVNIASTMGLKGHAGLTVYGASKWAMRGVSASLQAELQDTRCRVISVCPGAFASKLFAKATSAPNTINKGELMRAKDLARCIKQLLELPKGMEVSEIVINRR